MTLNRILGCTVTAMAAIVLMGATNSTSTSVQTTPAKIEGARRGDGTPANPRTISLPKSANADAAEKALHSSAGKSAATGPTAIPPSNPSASDERSKRRESNLRSRISNPGTHVSNGSRNQVPGTRGGPATLVVDDDGMGIASDCNDLTPCYSSIQAAINDANPGDTIIVFPGTYDETAAGSFLFDSSGPYQFGLFISVAKTGLKIQGVDCTGNPITDANSVAAHITTHATNDFGTSGTFIEADDVTITGLDFGQNAGQSNKTIELIGNNATFKYCKFTDTDVTYLYGGSFYIDDWRATVGSSYVQSYDIENCQFKFGMSTDVGSGPGITGPASGRKILNNSYDLNGWDYNAISFTGSGTCICWDFYDIGGATITGNSFTNGTSTYIKARGGYDNSTFNWQSIWSNNTFDKATITLSNVPSFVIRVYTYGDYDYCTNGFPYSPTCYPNSRHIGATIQDEITTIASSGDTILAKAGTYVENVVVSQSVTIAGSGQNTTFVKPAALGANTGGGSLGSGASSVFLVQANNVTIHDLTVDGDNPAISGGVNVGGANIDARNGIITNHLLGVYQNLNVHDTTIKNIYLRGLYASTGGSFDFEHNTITNVQADPASIGMFNFGGSGVMAYNNVSNANDAISSNWSSGTQYHHNVITSSGSGVHTDNNGGFGPPATADVIQSNTVSNGTAGSYGVWAFAPYLSPTISDNTVTNVVVGLAAAGSQAGGATVTFNRNTVDGQTLANSVGAYITTSLFGFGDADVNAVLNNNFIKNTIDGAYVQETGGQAAQAKFYNGSFTGNSNSNITNGGATAVDASANWWGSNIEGSLSAVGTIDHTPWLAVGTDTDLGTNGFQGDFSSLYVGTGGAQTGASGRIQEGINLASGGGTVHVLGGAYAGNVTTAGNNVNLSPGASPAQVTINGNLTLDSNDTLSIELNGPNAGTDYDQLVVNGTVALGGATLNLTRGFSPLNNQVFRIIDNDLADAVNGTFAGLAEGSLVYASGIPFKVSYVGGTGNDVILTTEEAATLVLSYDKSCYKPGDTLTATLRMSGLTGPAAGFQAFLQYDTGRLTFTSTPPVPAIYTPAPFGLPVLNTPALVNPSPGILNFASGINQLGGQIPSQLDADLVIFKFTVHDDMDECSIGHLLYFRDHNPPTRLTDIYGQPLAALTTINAPAITIDGTAPSVTAGTINSCYSNQALAEADALAATTATDDCGTPVKTVSTVGSCNAVITVTATDCAGNSASVQYNTHIDGTPPSITCPDNVTVQCASAVPPHDFAGGSASDNCGDPTVTWISDVISDQTCANRYTITRTYQATDGCNNSTSCTQTITVNDTTPPTINCPANVAVQCAAAVPPHDFAGGSASDNCGGTPTVTWVSDVISSQTCVNRYTITRTYKATDACGIDSTCTQTITVNDNTAPVISCPPDVTIECSDSVVPGLPFGSVTGGVMIYYNATGPEAPNNQAYLKSQYSYANTNGAQFTFSSVPLTGNGLTWAALFGQVAPPSQYGFDFVLPAPTNNGSVPTPVLNAYENVNNSAAGRALAGPVTWKIGDYKDNVPNGPGNAANVDINSLFRSASPGNPAVDLVLTQFTVTQAGNLFTATVAGYLKSDPSIHWYNPATPDSPMANFALTGTFYFSGTLTYDSTGDNGSDHKDFYAGTINISANSPNTALGFATATDNCTAFPVVGYTDDTSHLTGCSGTGYILRTWTATDECGNVSNCVQRINVVDDIPPVINCPPDVTVQCASLVPANDFAGGSASDNCGTPVVTWVSDEISGQTCPNHYTIARTYKATDGCGNESTCIQTITVNDTTLPVINCPPDVTVQCASDVPANDFAGGTASDNCGGTPLVVWVGDVVSNQTCVNRYTITRTYKATDDCGNSSTCAQTITVDDTTAPTITCPSNKTVNADAGGCTASSSTVNTGTATATDNCAPAPTVVGVRSDNGANSGQPAFNAPYPTGVTTIVWTATDACGNHSSCNQTVTVNAVNEMIVSVELSPNISPIGTLQRCITFQFWRCSPTVGPVEVSQVLDFTIAAGPPMSANTSVASNVSVLVPCGNYTCVTARDRLHTLRSTSGLTVNGSNQYVADFTGKRADEPGGGGIGHRLVGGNLNDDIFIDILDFGTWAGLYLHTYAGSPGLGDTTCSTPTPHADISGDGMVDSGDFTFIAANFLMVHENNCCTLAPFAGNGSAPWGTKNALGGEGPLRSITVAQLHQLGLGQLAVGDVNNDGVLDEQDIAAVFMGQMPRPSNVNKGGSHAASEGESAAQQTTESPVP